MLFNSLEYALFFAVFFGVFASLRARKASWRARKLVILAASYLFYAAWNPPFVLLLLFSTVLDHVAARRMARTERQAARRLWLSASLLGNLGVLAFFKYADFVLDTVWILSDRAFIYPAFVADIVLPVGISFYTFQSLSYTIDVYRREIRPTRSLLDLAVFVSFFPQLVAGPILRAREFLPQLERPREASAEDGLRGIGQIARGLAKKVILADGLAAYVDVVFADPGSFGAVNTWLALLAYGFQIYCDFSGYSDIAIGTARLLGFEIPRNFDLPYASRNPAEFWRRWHISLSTWLRDYLYVSLGGSRGGRLLTYRNLFLTMLLGGLWHGAGWNWLVWGAFHGTWLAAHRMLFRDRQGPAVPNWLAWLVTFLLVTFGWLFFRAESFEGMVAGLVALSDFSTPVFQVPPSILLIGGVAALAHVLGGSGRLARLWEGTGVGWKGLAYALVLVGIFLMSPTTGRFIYFQF